MASFAITATLGLAGNPTPSYRRMGLVYYADSVRNPSVATYVQVDVEQFPMRRSANGAVILVLGILGWAGLGIFTALPAWIMGNQSLRMIETGQADAAELGLVQAGRILGMILSIIFLAAISVGILIILGIALTALVAG